MLVAPSLQAGAGTHKTGAVVALCSVSAFTTLP